MQKHPPESSNDAVLILRAMNGVPWRFRCFHAFEQLQLAGVNCAICQLDGRWARLGIERYSVVIFHRVPYDKYVDRLLREIHHRGAIAIFDIDDLVFDPSVIRWIVNPDLQNPVRAALYRDELKRCRTTLALCDAVTASTRYLSEQASSFGKPAWVHRNAFSMEMLSLFGRAHSQQQHGVGSVVIGYASGTPTHDRDFQQAKPALQQILCKYPQTELWILGYPDPGSDWGACSDRIRYIPFVPWHQVPKILAQFDINIAPLEINNPFCQAKSEVKYIEAGLVKIPTVASKTAAFGFAIRSGDNGFLATTHEDWVMFLERLVDNAALRREMGERAYTDILERYHPVVRGRELISTLDQISEHVRGRPFWLKKATDTLDARQLAGIVTLETFASNPAFERRPSFMQRALYSLRYRGLRISLMQAWLYIRHHLARVVA